MSDTLKVFEFAYETYDTEITNILNKWRLAETSLSNLKLLCHGTMREIAKAVHELKDAGQVGDTITPFLADRDVKKLHDGLLEHFEAMKPHHAKIEKKKVELKAAYANVLKLQGKIDKEGKSLKRAVLGSKSVEGMTDLAEKIDKDMKAVMPGFNASVTTLSKETAATFSADVGLTKQLNELIKKKKANLDEKEADEAMEQALNIRLLIGKRNGLLKQGKELSDHVRQAVTLLRERRNSEAKARLKLASDTAGEIHEVHESVQKAYESVLKGSAREKTPDGQKVKGMVEDMEKIDAKAQKEFTICKKVMAEMMAEMAAEKK